MVRNQDFKDGRFFLAPYTAPKDSNLTIGEYRSNQFQRLELVALMGPIWFCLTYTTVLFFT